MLCFLIRSVTRRRRLLSVPVGAAAMAACAVGTLAYFHATGSGTGSAKAGSLQTVTVSALAGGDAPSSLLLPGGSADVILRVNNPNAFAVTLVSVTGNGSITADSGGHPGCTTTGLTFTNQTTLSVSVPAGSSLVHLSGAASMSAASSNGCQGAIFSIPVAITVHK